MGLLTATEILKAKDLVTEEVATGWGGSVLVKTLEGYERDEFEESFRQGKGANKEQRLTNFRAKLCVRTIVDREGNRLFRDDQADELGKKSAKELDRIVDVALRLCGMTKEAMEEAAKKSVSPQSDDSGLPSVTDTESLSLVSNGK